MAPLSSQGSLALESVRLPRWKYLSESLKFQILAGSLSANADYSFDGSGDEPALTVSNGELTTENIEIGSKRRTEKEIAVLDPSRIVGDPTDLGFAIDATGSVAGFSKFSGQCIQHCGETHQISPSPLAVDCVSKRIVTGPLLSAKTVPGGGCWATARP